jgi:hypothetical protein
VVVVAIIPAALLELAVLAAAVMGMVPRVSPILEVEVVEVRMVPLVETAGPALSSSDTAMD